MNHTSIRLGFTTLISIAMLSACTTNPPVVKAPDATVSGLSADIALNGTAVTVSGTNFASDASVNVGGAAATVTARSATALTFTVPAELGGYADVTVTSGGKAHTAPAKLFVGKLISDTTTTTADIQAALNTLPVGSALMLAAKTYVWDGSTDLFVDNRSLYGAGDTTVVEGDVNVLMSGTRTVTLNDVKLVTDNFYLGNGELNQAQIEAAMAERASTAGHTTDAKPEAKISAQGFDFTTHNISHAVLDGVTIVAATEGNGYFDNEAYLSTLTVRDSNIDLDSYVYLGNWGAGIAVERSTISGDDRVDLETNAGGVRVIDSTLKSLITVDIYAESGDVIVDNSTLTALGGNYNYIYVGGDLGKVQVTRSTVDAHDTDTLNGLQTGSVNIRAWDGTDVFIQNNPLINSDGYINFYTDYSDLSEVVASGNLTVTGNGVIIAGDGIDGASNGNVQMYAGGHVTVKDNDELTSNQVLSVYSRTGNVDFSDNPNVTVRSTSDGTSADGELRVYTDNYAVNSSNDVTFANNTVTADKLVYVNAAYGKLNVTGNTVNVTGKNAPRVFLESQINRAASVTNNTFTVADPSAASIAEFVTILGMGSSPFYSNFTFGTLPKAAYAFTGNTVTTTGGAGTKASVIGGEGTLDATGNTLTSSGSNEFSAYAGTVNATGNTVTAPALTVRAYAGVDADADASNGVSDPSTVNFTGNTVNGVASEAAITKTIVDATSGSVTVSGNTVNP